MVPLGEGDAVRVEEIDLLSRPELNIHNGDQLRGIGFFHDKLLTFIGNYAHSSPNLPLRGRGTAAAVDEGPYARERFVADTRFLRAALAHNAPPQSR